VPGRKVKEKKVGILIPTKDLEGTEMFQYRKAVFSILCRQVAQYDATENIMQSYQYPGNPKLRTLSREFPSLDLEALSWEPPNALLILILIPKKTPFSILVV